MFYSRKLAPVITIGLAFGGAAVIYLETGADGVTVSAGSRLVLRLVVLTSSILSAIALDICLVLVFGRTEIRGRTTAMWRTLLDIPSGSPNHAVRVEDLLDYLALVWIRWQCFGFNRGKWRWALDAALQTPGRHSRSRTDQGI